MCVPCRWVDTEDFIHLLNSQALCMNLTDAEVKYDFMSLCVTVLSVLVCYITSMQTSS